MGAVTIKMKTEENDNDIKYKSSNKFKVYR